MSGDATTTWTRPKWILVASTALVSLLLHTSQGSFVPFVSSNYRTTTNALLPSNTPHYSNTKSLSVHQHDRSSEASVTATTIASPAVCEICQEAFPSRNALFRHLQSSRDCGAQTNLPTKSTPFLLVLQFSYYCEQHRVRDQHDMKDNIGIFEGDISEAQLAGEKLQQAIQNGIQLFLQAKGIEQTDASIELLGTSQSSLGRLRHRVLDQEVGCAAAKDTLMVRLKVSQLDFNQKDEDGQQQVLKSILQFTNDVLRQEESETDGLHVQLEGCKLWSATDSSHKSLHGEQSCTQRIYHYLLPLRWLPDGRALERWWIETAVAQEGTHINRSSERPPSESLKHMKQLLRSAESERLDPRESSGDKSDDKEDMKVAAGRFGTLGGKKRRAWHNFADPRLQGRASPSNKPVWRVLDRARFQTLFTRSNEEVVAVLEFRGDDFLPHQIRRLVGTTLAMTHRWLPVNTLDIATSSDCFLETVLAPPGRLYLAENRFHWDEMRTGGKSIFDSNVDGVAVRNDVITNSTLQDTLLDACNNDMTKKSEDQWLWHLQHVVSPRICKSVEEWEGGHLMNKTAMPIEMSNCLSSPPKYYQRTLELLRGILTSGKWPETSVARSSVIGNVNRSDEETVHQKGSFTVINPNFRNGLYRTGVGNDPLPLGNCLFPELAEAVFDLEVALAIAEESISRAHVDQYPNNDPTYIRPVSSHCAINCNAQFTPHVDSGRGAGQSLSMIVGLGDYVGGKLGVEGKYHDIRYQPLEFDGWRLRHWTKVFEGERFSLVWFTPELKGDEMQHDAAGEAITM